VAQIRRSEESIEVLVDRRERAALLQILERLEPMLEESSWANPRAYDDEKLEQEFRRLVGSDLDDSRSSDIAKMRSSLESEGPILLSHEATWGWLRALNVLRLALAERLGLDEDGWEDRFSQRQHRRPPLATLHLLSWVQEELVEELAVP